MVGIDAQMNARSDKIHTNIGEETMEWMDYVDLRTSVILEIPADENGHYWLQELGGLLVEEDYGIPYNAMVRGLL